MRLSKIDLNLFVVFEAIYNKRNLTRAAEVLNLTQPAVSNALARLRFLFKDEILARTAVGMELTPRAQALAMPIRQIMQQIEE